MSYLMAIYLLECKKTIWFYKNGNYQQDGNARAMSTMRVSRKRWAWFRYPPIQSLLQTNSTFIPTRAQALCALYFPMGSMGNNGGVQPSRHLVPDHGFRQTPCPIFFFFFFFFLNFKIWFQAFIWWKLLIKNGKTAVGKLVLTE